MAGSRMKFLKESCKLFLQSLDPSDKIKINIVRFGSTFEKMFPSPRVFKRNTFNQAMRYIDQTDSNLRQTDILSPLISVLEAPITEGYTRQLYLATDGEDPNTFKIIGECKKYLQTTRIFTIGIGNDINAFLINQVAKSTMGRSCFLKNSGDIKKNVMEQLAFSIQPSLQNVSCEFDEEFGKVKKIVSKFPPIYCNQRHIEYYFLENFPKEKEVKFVYHLGEKLEKKHTSCVPEEVEIVDGLSVIGILAASKRITELQMFGKDGKVDKPEIRRLGLLFNLLSSETSFVVQKENDQTIVQELKVEKIPNVYHQMEKDKKSESRLVDWGINGMRENSAFRSRSRSSKKPVLKSGGASIPLFSGVSGVFRNLFGGKGKKKKKSVNRMYEQASSRSRSRSSNRSKSNQNWRRVRDHKRKKKSSRKKKSILSLDPLKAFQPPSRKIPEPEPEPESIINIPPKVERSSYYVGGRAMTTDGIVSDSPFNGGGMGGIGSESGLEKKNDLYIEIQKRKKERKKRLKKGGDDIFNEIRSSKFDLKKVDERKGKEISTGEKLSLMNQLSQNLSTRKESLQVSSDDDYIDDDDPIGWGKLDESERNFEGEDLELTDEEEGECSTEKDLQSINKKILGIKGGEFDKITYSQSLMGEWVLCEEIAKVIKIPYKTIMENNPVKEKGNMWITAIIVIILKMFYTEKKIEWKLLVKKAEKVLKKNKCGNLLKNAREFVKKYRE